MLPFDSTIRERLRRICQSAGAMLPPLSSSEPVKALFAPPLPSAAEIPVHNQPRVALAGHVPLTNGAVFHRVALDG